MKNYLRILILLNLLIAPVLSSAAEEESSRPSWFERIFGTKDVKESQREAAEEAEKSKKAAKSNEGAKSKDAEKSKELVETEEERGFTKEERAVLESWQKGNAGWKKSDKPLPPGLKKKVARGGELPPGWKKKLEAGAVLEPELDAQAETLPEEILRRLPETEVGTEIIRVGDEIIKVMENSREIIDILKGSGTAEN